MPDRLSPLLLEGLAPLPPPVADRLASLTEAWFDEAAMVDQSDTVPQGHLDALAASGLYGAVAPVADGGLGLTRDQVFAAVEQLASASLASTFVWVQHFGLVEALLASPNGALRRWLPDVVRGRLTGGISFAGALPGPPRLRAMPVADGWLLNGTAPWVTGWGIVDILLVAARGPHDQVVRLALDAQAVPGLTARRLPLAAMHATRTVELTWDNVFVSNAREVSQEPYDPSARNGEGLRGNGALALGVARRAAVLLGPSHLDRDVAQCRATLQAADADGMPGARAMASYLAVRAAHLLAVHRGSRSALRGDPAERLQREASVLLVFGSRPAIRQALLDEWQYQAETPSP